MLEITLAEIDHRLKKLQHGLRKLGSDVLTMYNCIDSLGNKVFIPTIINVDLRTILKTHTKNYSQVSKLA